MPDTFHPDDLIALLPKLRARARRLTGHPDLAEDLVQEIALKLWQTAQSGTKIDTPEAYAMTALRHLIVSRARGAEQNLPLEDDCATTPPEAPARLSLARTHAAINRLPPEQARLMRRVAGGETSPTDLARALHLPPGTVMSRLARARARLRRDMGLPAKNAIDSLM